MSSSVVCDYVAAGWEVNASGQNACQVYAALQGVCNPAFTIASVGATSPPYVPQDNACGCNVVAYNLMGGCGWCQSQILTTWWLTESQWAGNCTTTAFDATGLPTTISTASVQIPAWAFVVPDILTWDPSQAQVAAAAASPSNTLATQTPTIPVLNTAFSTPSLSLNFDTSINNPALSYGEGGYSQSFTLFSGGDDSDFNNNSNSGGKAAGAAIGVILGLYAILAIVVGLVYMARQKKRKAWYGPMAQYYQGARNGGAGVAAPLMYNNAGGTPYEPSKTPGAGSAYTGYQPPPPEQAGYTGYQQGYVQQPQPYIVPNQTGTTTTNTNSIYGGVSANPNTNSMYGAPPTGPPPGAAVANPGMAGYKGYAEVH